LTRRKLVTHEFRYGDVRCHISANTFRQGENNAPPARGDSDTVDNQLDKEKGNSSSSSSPWWHARVSCLWLHDPSYGRYTSPPRVQPNGSRIVESFSKSCGIYTLFKNLARACQGLVSTVLKLFIRVMRRTCPNAPVQMQSQCQSL
jgi:hypothetical protein